MKYFKVLNKYKWYFLLVICLISLLLGTIVYADKISDIQNDIADIKSQQSEATRKMQEAEDNIKLSYEKMEQDQQRISLEFDAKIADKKTELNNYKSEISYLREKIRVTLNKFDEILANSVK